VVPAHNPKVAEAFERLAAALRVDRAGGDVATERLGNLEVEELWGVESKARVGDPLCHVAP